MIATRAQPIAPGAKVVARIRLVRGAVAPLGGGALTAGEGAVWAMTDARSMLLRIDPARNAVEARIKVPPTEAIAAGDGAVWLSHPADNTVTRVDPATNKVVGVIEGIEAPRYRFCLGVQWHPEFHISEGDRRIFTAFVAAAAQK